MRSIRSSIVAPLCLVCVALLSQSAFAAAQLAAGAKTSAQPTATNPQQRQLQITFDPNLVVTNSTADYHLDDFQLSVAYDASKLTLDSIFFVPPFTENNNLLESTTPNTPAFSPAGQQASNFLNDPQNGLISFISGSANPNNVGSGDVNIFIVNFIVNNNVDLNNDPLFIKIFGNPDTQDFTHGTDPNTGQTAFADALNIAPTILNGTFNQYGQQAGSNGVVASTPLPSGVAAGALLAGMLLAAGAYNRKHRVAA